MEMINNFVNAKMPDGRKIKFRITDISSVYYSIHDDKCILIKNINGKEEGFIFDTKEEADYFFGSFI